MRRTNHSVNQNLFPYLSLTLRSPTHTRAMRELTNVINALDHELAGEFER